MEDMTTVKMDDEALDAVSGGAGIPTQSSNFCRICRGAGYKLLSKDQNGTQKRECTTCHFVYFYRP